MERLRLFCPTRTTLFIPIRNEIRDVREIMPYIKKEWADEIVVIDGNSTDGTCDTFRIEGFRAIRQKFSVICDTYWECCEVTTGDIEAFAKKKMIYILDNYSCCSEIAKKARLKAKAKFRCSFNFLE